MAARRQSSIQGGSSPTVFASGFFQPRPSVRFGDSRLNDSFSSSSHTGGNTSFGGGSFNAATPARTRSTRDRESAFGPSGLRSRPQQAGEHPQSTMRSPSLSLNSRRGTAASPHSLDEDNVPPPNQPLDDDDAMDTSNLTAPGTYPFGTGSGSTPVLTPASAAPAPAQSSTSSFRSSVPAAGSEDLKFRTLLLYGFPGSLEGLVLEHFGLGLESSEWKPFTEVREGAGCIQAVYKDKRTALRALRRSGELVAGLAIVGVRVKDDTLHRTLQIDGLSSGGALSADLLTPTPNPNSSTVPSTPQHTTTHRASGTSGGRPLSVMGTRGSALAPADTSSSFFRIPGWSSSPAAAAAPSTQESDTLPRSSSFLGRVNDAVFGW